MNSKTNLFWKTLQNLSKKSFLDNLACFEITMLIEKTTLLGDKNTSITNVPLRYHKNST